MKFLFDLFPVILFFIAYKFGAGHPQLTQDFVSRYFSGIGSGTAISALQAPILLATAVAIGATVLQIGYLLARRKKVDTMLWLSFVIITIFGGATIYFHSDVFIKWKPTILYWCFGGGLLIGQFIFKKNLIRNMIADQITLPDTVWSRLGLAWGCFFVLQGCLNLFIAFNFSTEIWVNYKLFGGIGLMVAFIIGQSLVLTKYMKDPQ